MPGVSARPESGLFVVIPANAGIQNERLCLDFHFPSGRLDSGSCTRWASPFYSAHPWAPPFRPDFVCSNLLPANRCFGKRGQNHLPTTCSSGFVATLSCSAKNPGFTIRGKPVRREIDSLDQFHFPAHPSALHNFRRTQKSAQTCCVLNPEIAPVLGCV